MAVSKKPETWMETVARTIARLLATDSLGRVEVMIGAFRRALAAARTWTPRSSTRRKRRTSGPIG